MRKVPVGMVTHDSSISCAPAGMTQKPSPSLTSATARVNDARRDGFMLSSDIDE